MADQLTQTKHPLAMTKIYKGMGAGVPKKPIEPEVLDPVGVGRPSKYDDQTIPKALDYLENYITKGDVIPNICGLAEALNVSRPTIYEWVKDSTKEEFSYIIERLLAKQEQVLINQGLINGFNPNITKLILGKHGYHDKVDNEHSLSPDSAVPRQYVVQPVRALGSVTPEENHDSKNDSDRDPGKADSDTG